MTVDITGACGWNVDESYDSYVFALFPSGDLKAYTISSTGFILVKTIKVYSTAVTCTSNFAVKAGWGTV